MSRATLVLLLLLFPLTNPLSLPIQKNLSLLTPEAPHEKVGVLLLNLGGPAKSADVEGFLYNLFSDPGEQ